jgi:ATP/maltotriose-dependent transcriptional regulator MalT
MRKILAAFSGFEQPVAVFNEPPETRPDGLVSGGLDELAPVEPLSKRELEVLHLIGEGCSNQEIAERLVLSIHTVKKHINNVFIKLGVNSRTQAVARGRDLYRL